MRIPEKIRVAIILLGCLISAVFICALIVDWLNVFFDWFPRGGVPSTIGVYIFSILFYYVIAGWLINLIAILLSIKWHPNRWVKLVAILLNLAPIIITVLGLVWAWQ